jgi:hypothetical protein
MNVMAGLGHSRSKDGVASLACIIPIGGALPSQAGLPVKPGNDDVESSEFSAP